MIKIGSEGILHGQRVVCVWIKDRHGRPLDTVDTDDASQNYEILVCWNGARIAQGAGWSTRSYYGSWSSEEGDRARLYQYGWWIASVSLDIIWLTDKQLRKRNSEKYKEKLKKEFKELQFKPVKREKEISRLYYLRKQLNLLNDQNTPPTSE